MGRVIIPRPRMLHGRRAASMTTTAEIPTGSAWDTNLRTMAALAYNVAGQGGWWVRDNHIFGMVSDTFAWDRKSTGTTTSLNSGSGFMAPTMNRFAWVFALCNGSTSAPDGAYCILGERAVIQTSGWATRGTGTGTFLATVDPSSYGSRDNATGFVLMPFYAFGVWPRVLTVAEMTALARWDVPLDPVAFLLNDDRRDLATGNHLDAFNDLEQNRVDNTYPALRIPAR